MQIYMPKNIRSLLQGRDMMTFPGNVFDAAVTCNKSIYSSPSYAPLLRGKD